MKFWIILFGIVLVLGIGSFVILGNLHTDDHLTTSQKEKALYGLLGHAPVVSPPDHTTWKTYTSPVMTFDYPGWASINTADNIAAKKNARSLDSFHFTLLDQHITATLAVSGQLSIATVSGDSGVHIRLADPDYTPVGSVSATKAEFFNATGEERSLFVLQQDKEYTIVVSGGKDEDNKAIFERITSSFVLR